LPGRFDGIFRIVGLQAHAADRDPRGGGHGRLAGCDAGLQSGFDHPCRQRLFAGAHIQLRNRQDGNGLLGQGRGRDLAAQHILGFRGSVQGQQRLEQVAVGFPGLRVDPAPGFDRLQGGIARTALEREFGRPLVQGRVAGAACGVQEDRVAARNGAFLHAELAEQQLVHQPAVHAGVDRRVGGRVGAQRRRLGWHRLALRWRFLRRNGKARQGRKKEERAKRGGPIHGGIIKEALRFFRTPGVGRTVDRVSARRGRGDNAPHA